MRKQYPIIIGFLSSAFALSFAAVQAQTIYWTGDAENSSWASGSNWSGGVVAGTGTASGADVVINNTNGISGIRITSFAGTSADPRRLNSLTIDVAALELHQDGNPHMLLGDAENIGRFTLTSNYTTGTSAGLFMGGGSATQSRYRRGRLMFDKGIVFTNNGTGLAQFGNAYIQNANSDPLIPSSGTITFAGTGSWRFNATSYIGKNRNAPGSSNPWPAGSINTPNAVVNVQLGNSEESFSGKLSYASELAMEVTNVEVNQGTLELVNSGINNTGLLSVAQGASFTGTGTVSGETEVAGTLKPGTSNDLYGKLNFLDSLTLISTAVVELAINGTADGSFNEIVLDGGALIYGGDLLISLTGSYVAGDSWELFSGFGSTAGDFASVVLNGTSLTQSGDQWFANIGGTGYQFDQSNGMMSVVVPEPGQTALVLGLGVLALSMLRRRARRA